MLGVETVVVVTFIGTAVLLETMVTLSAHLLRKL